MTPQPSRPDAGPPAREPVFEVGIRCMDLFVRATTRLRVTGIEHIPAGGPALVVANHVSFLDPVVIGALVHRGGRKLRFLAVQEAFDKPVVGWFLKVAQQIPVGTGTERLTAIRRARSMLEAGEVVGIYPEGTITAADGGTGGAQGGAGLLALSTGAPVIPIATTGLERGGGPWWRRRPATAVVGPPLDLAPVAGLTGRARYAAAGELMLAAIRDLTPR